MTICEMNRPPSFLDGQNPPSFCAGSRNHAAQRERHRLAVKETWAAHFRIVIRHRWPRMAFSRSRLSVHRRVAQRPCAAICDDSRNDLGRAWPLRHSPMHRQPRTREGHARPSVTIREMNGCQGNLAADSFRESSQTAGHGLAFAAVCASASGAKAMRGRFISRIVTDGRAWPFAPLADAQTAANARRPCAAICDDSRNERLPVPTAKVECSFALRCVIACGAKDIDWPSRKLGGRFISRIVTDGRAWPLRTLADAQTAANARGPLASVCGL